jgi:hypothetical protein
MNKNNKGNKSNALSVRKRDIWTPWKGVLLNPDPPSIHTSNYDALSVV